jgi:murein DD-endopeptidase MepM/ murein hydrolase activator NlpD
MRIRPWLRCFPILLLAMTTPVVAQDSLCPAPALSRLGRHTVQAGETLDAIAQQYDLIPATLIGMNPSLRSGSPAVGQALLIPPYNGIRVEVPAGTTWQDVAIAYNVRADVLFEVNGCQTQPQAVFVPGVNWSPNLMTPDYGEAPQASVEHNLQGYPLPNPAPVILGYGWQSHPTEDRLTFSSGVGLAANPGTAVLAVGDGVVAFAGPQSGIGNLVVINHAQGLQTRYAQLANLEVVVGQSVRQGDRIGQVQPAAPEGAYLYFEVRSNSSLGWVAEDPQRYIPRLGVR